jgi:hypothetical protein
MGTLLGLALLALAAGCAGPGTVPGAAPAVTLDAVPVDAALVTPQFGWVLTADQVLLTRDGGRSFQPAAVKLPDGLARTAYFRDADDGWVASADGTTVSVARTTDGGTSWQVTTIPAGEPIGALSIGFDSGPDGVGLDGGLVAKVQTSGAFSKAHLYSTADGGASWRAATAPVAGQVTVEPDGRLWLAGGVLGNELYTSTDGGTSWHQVTSWVEQLN